jgi:FKBP-type peptidyl-prolyl cis-trans isomerase
VGTGATAVSGQRISVNYTGWLYSNTAPDNKGSQFDTSAGRGVFSFTPGAGQVIRGWDQGVPGMRVGGLRRLVIPPDMAYGSSGSGPIPPNATLLFEVELVSIP